jgi:hypothetical protein
MKIGGLRVDIEKVEGPKCKMSEIGISRNCFSKGKPVDRAPVHDGPTVARIEGIIARRHAHRSMASGHSGAWKLIDGGTTERGEHGELGSGLTGARVAAVGAGWGGSCGLGSEQRRAG